MPIGKGLQGRWRWVALLGVTAALALIIVAALRYWGDDDQSTPDDRSAEAGFARDMQTHHAQAVQMAFIIRDKTDDKALRAISYDIITTQQQQMGQMFAWLQQWNLPSTSSQPPMAWMPDTSHDMMPGMPLPGMATDQQIARLQSLDSAKAETLFLRLMIDHHRAGIDMARAVLRLTDHPQVSALAESIAQAQQTEIDQMQTMLSRTR